MRPRGVTLLACSGVLSLGFMMLGCPVSSSEDCEALGTCNTTSSGTGSTGTTSSLPAECTSFVDGELVGESCGVFVNPASGSDASGDGSQKAPYATISRALEDAKAVYICAGSVNESITVTQEAHLFGGFECGQWTYDASRPTLTAPVGSPAVIVAPGLLFTAHDLLIAAPDAAAPGGNALAILLQKDNELELTRVNVIVGSGKAGADGTTPDTVGPGGEGGKGQNGMMGAAGCLADTANLGGDGGVNTCSGTSVAGGTGGTGNKTFGDDGSTGQPKTPMSGEGGAGDGGNGCVYGGNGKPGEDGKPGAGAAAGGTLTSDGFIGAPGKDGATGTPGQGGGGGGGARVCMNGKPGPSGGGGGAGGCGGAGGRGGQAGGSSIGIAAILPKHIALDNVDIQTGLGGNGGGGADGQVGGLGGGPGLAGDGDAVAVACSGGNGGKGGKGGKGGGGRGGHSIGIVMTGSPIIDEMTTTYTTNTPGKGGMGTAGDLTTMGQAGLEQPTLQLE